ncbi:putative transcription factor [Metarhizium acridum CQMa 102]|uniref:Putative transcription factor n=1 Tax=Metarhizium acridum (strain CQMa 102) TaxID=655827 RepID=E9E9P6_METAQ|nr:putative transcription factor [Metarhizium acridum CQMa 102]EFY87359.1 putative transcription factor [Metarhizium acridum CQMa 102]
MDGTADAAQLHFSQPEAAKVGGSSSPGPPAPQSSVLHEDDSSFFVSPRSTTFVDFTWVPRGAGAPSPAGRSWSRSTTSTWSARSSSRSTSCGQGYGSYSSHGCGSFSGRRPRCSVGPGGAASAGGAGGGATCTGSGSLGAAGAGVSPAASADVGDVDACVFDVDMDDASLSPTSPAHPGAANPASPAGPAAARPPTSRPPAVESGPAAAATCAPPPAPASTTSTSTTAPTPTTCTAAANTTVPHHQQLEGTTGRCASGSSSLQHEACIGPPAVAAPTPSFRSSVPTAVPTFIPTLLPSSAPSSAPSSSLPTPIPTSSSGIHINTAVPSSLRLGSSSSSSPSPSCNSSPTGVASIHVSSAISSSTSISPRSTKPPAPVAFNVKMPPRPAKRSADGSGASDDDASASSTAKLKLARSDRGPEDFSSVVKNRLQSYTRTGQACDRCKVRKIRCDALPEGCSHCINLNLDCYVTDRVTGRTERRGYMQQLEREKSRMMSHIRDLERLCAEKNVEVKPFQGRVRAQSPPEAADEEDSSNASANVAAASSNDGWSQFGSLWIKDSSPPDPTSSIIRHKVPRNEWQTRPEQSRWGVGSDDAPLSSLKGMTLTLLGTTIETTSFDAPDVDEPPTAADPSVPLYNKSVQAFLRSAMRVNPAVQVELPTRENAFIYAEWYFITVASFMPLLHKPTFMKLLTRVYDEPGFKPTVPELVLVHMVFAVILFQFGVRNSETLEQRNNFNDLSNKHYHFALSKMYEIFSSTDFEALQGLVLIASHTRAFPKPGCGSIVASMALHRALELNYHRRTKKPGEPTDLQNELRKRAWWNMMMVVVDINGKRGYPIPVSVQDFDVDFPEPIADELLSDEGVDTSRTVPCPYEVAIAAFKCIPIYMEMYANIFSVRRDESNYRNVLAVLEAQMRQWEADLPESMRLSPAKKNDHGMVGALFARTYMLEFRLHIRHPSLAMTTDAALIDENTKICEEAAREYLQTVEHLSRMKALDTTWHQMSLYCVAILSMLVPQWQRRFEITQDEVARLRDEMQRWMKIADLAGCGTGMSTQIAQLINRTMSWIEHDMPQKDAKNPILTHASVKQEQKLPLQGTVPLAPQEQQQNTHAVQFGTVANQNQSFPSADTSRAEELTKNFYHANITAPAHATYPSLAYMDQQTQPNPQATTSYQHNQTELYYPNTSAAAGHPGGPAQTDTLAGYSSEAGQHLCHQNADIMWRSSWQNWSAAIAESQQRYGADSLMTLGDAETVRNSVITPIMTGNGMPHTGSELPMVPQPASWPLIMFDQTPRD